MKFASLFMATALCASLASTSHAASLVDEVSGDVLGQNADETSCLFGTQGHYQTGLRPAEPERVDWVRAQMKMYATTKYLRNKGKILFSIAEYVRFGFDYSNQCNVELADFLLEHVINGNQLEYSPLLLAAVSTAGALPDITGVVEKKSQILVSLFASPATRFTPWKDDAPSSGTITPDLEYLHTALAGQMIHSNLLLNNQQYRSFLQKYVVASKEYRMREVIAPELKKLADFHKGPWTGADKNIGKQLMNYWISEVPAQLKITNLGIYPQMTAIATMDTLGSYARVYGLEPQVRALLEGIVKTYSNPVNPMPIEIYRAAKAALVTLDTSSTH